MNEPEFFLYSRHPCHLCEELQKQLATLLQETKYRCHIINIDNDPELMQRYGARVPVLVAEGRELCELEFNLQVIRDYLTEKGL